MDRCEARGAHPENMSNRAAKEVETPSVMVVEQDIRTLQSFKNISTMMDKFINILALESENKDTENQEKRNNYEDADTLNQRIRIFWVCLCSHLYINLACLFVCLFVSNKRQNGWTDRAQIFCRTSRDSREGLWKIKILNICLHQNSIVIKFLKILKIREIFSENPRIIFVLFYDVHKENVFRTNLEDGHEAPSKASEFIFDHHQIQFNPGLCFFSFFNEHLIYVLVLVRNIRNNHHAP